MAGHGGIGHERVDRTNLLVSRGAELRAVARAAAHDSCALVFELTEAFGVPEPLLDEVSQRAPEHRPSPAWIPCWDITTSRGSAGRRWRST